MVLPIGGADAASAKALTDGHIYTTISLPGAAGCRIMRGSSLEDRWNVVNYLRELNGQGGRP